MIELTVFTVAPFRRPNHNHNCEVLEAIRAGRSLAPRSIAYGPQPWWWSGIITRAKRAKLSPVINLKTGFHSGYYSTARSPQRSWAQGTPRRVGYLDGAPKYLPLFKVWQDGVRDHGWIEGKNLIIDYRSAEGHAERVPPLANELVALKPDLLFGPGPQVALILKSATATIPIVFVAVFDPVAIGLVQSLSRPRGNITGLATDARGDWIAKRIEMFRELIPSASKIALLVHPGSPTNRLVLANELQPGAWAWPCR